MNREDIIRMAQEAGISESHAQGMQGFLERFAALVAAAERSACAKLCQELKPFGPHLYIQKATAQDCAAAIRARGEK